jgi:recombination protein RecA
MAKTTKKAAAKKSRKKAAAKKPPTPKQYLKALKERSGKKGPAWGMLSEDVFATAVKERVPTGSLAVDRLTGGGWPVTRIVEVASWENVGKSTLLDQSLASVQRMGGIAALIDTETARDEVYTAKLGVDVDELLVQPAETIEEVFLALDYLLDLQEKVRADLKAEPPIMLIVWDAIGGTMSDAEKEGEPDDKHVGVAARVIKMNFRRICLRLARNRAVLICANHFYKTIGGPMSTLVTYGGSGIRYFTSLRVWLRATGKIKIGDTEVGHSVETKLKKTKIGKPRPPEEAGLIWGAGFDNSYSLFNWGLTHGVSESHRWVARSGSWYYLMLPDGTSEGFQHGFAGFGAVLQQRPDIYAEMAEQYLSGDL